MRERHEKPDPLECAVIDTLGAIARMADRTNAQVDGLTKQETEKVIAQINKLAKKIRSAHVG